MKKSAKISKIFILLVITAMVLVACGGDANNNAGNNNAGNDNAGNDNASNNNDAEEPPLETGELKDVAREDTLIVGWSISSPLGVTNPWAIPGYTHQEANGMMWEGLSYFRIFADEEAPWLAESMVYTKDDFTELTITLRPEAKWSDGVQVTSADVVFTLEGQLADNTLPYHAAFVQFVDTVVAVDDLAESAPGYRLTVRAKQTESTRG